MKTAIDFFESKGHEFDKDKDDLWMEESVEELKWKDVFEYFDEYSSSLKSKAEKWDKLENYFYDTLEQNDACELGLHVSQIILPQG